MVADAAYLAAAIDAVEERCGGVDAYFETVLGIDRSARAAFVEALTEPVAG